MNEPLDRPGFGQNVVPIEEYRGDHGRTPAAPTATVAPIASVESEAGLIGCIMQAPHVFPLVQHLVAAEHFFEEAHRAIWQVMGDLVAAGDTPNGIKVKAALGATNLAFDLGGQNVLSYLGRLVVMACTPISAPEYARTIQQYWQLRELAAVTNKAADGSGFVPGPHLERVYARVDQIRASFVDRKVMSVTADEAGDELIADITADLQGHGRVVPHTRVEAFDKEIGGGPQPSTLITVAARTAMGKSIFGVEQASAIGRQGHLAIYHSLEMTRKQIQARRTSSWLFDRGTKLAYEQIMRRRGLSPSEADHVADAVYEMRGEHFHIEDGGGRTIGDIAAASDRLANSYARKGVPLGMVVIDHAHIVRPSRAYNREDEGLKEVADGALSLAKHLDVPVLLLAQCNRNTEGKSVEDRRPSLADIRGAGAFEENSDAVAFLYRPAYYIERSGKYREQNPEALAEHAGCRHLLEIIIDKNRIGRANHIVRAWIDPALNAIRNLQPGV
ncbi:replicative DNA helicase [Methylobacterium sp. E-045]|uniref:replicative DNA helicase n=1 Tax=Methylobacterium sp. E-045 TaxID=2836575 RepID=UPI001FB891CC|nr:replicative DNA helicase [Methylobacterium sp. E-045]MCJ2129245.1 replicative DNA helicase [Methylobacterium sp. E-045]